MIRSIKILAPIIVLGASWAIAQPIAASTQSDLTVAIDGLKNHRGQACLRVFSSSRGFPNTDEAVVQGQCVKIGANPVTVTFRNLKAGSYAVAVLHDANNDRQANRNALGIPTEGFGFSRNPVIRTGPPKFGDSAIVVAGSTNIRIQMRYLF